MSAITFTERDFDNLELARQIILRRLKYDRSWAQFDYSWEPRYTDKYVIFEHDRLRHRFVVLANEVMWSLIVQGVITPGKDAANLALPWFRLTTYGEKVLEAERFVAHDPAGYLDDVGSVAVTSIGRASLPYLAEALQCFTSGCHVASVLLLGVAAEAVFLSLCSKVEQVLTNSKEQARFKRLQQVKPKHRWLVQKIESLPAQQRRSELPESLDVTLTSLYDLIRRQRNELGHPQAQLPSIDRELAFTYFKLTSYP